MDQAHPLTKTSGIVCSQRLTPVDHSTLCGIDESCEDLEKSGLPRPVGTHDGRGRARPDDEVFDRQDLSLPVPDFQVLKPKGHTRDLPCSHHQPEGDVRSER